MSVKIYREYRLACEQNDLPHNGAPPAGAVVVAAGAVVVLVVGATAVVVVRVLVTRVAVVRIAVVVGTEPPLPPHVATGPPGALYALGTKPL